MNQNLKICKLRHFTCKIIHNLWKFRNIFYRKKHNKSHLIKPFYQNYLYKKIFLSIIVYFYFLIFLSFVSMEILIFLKKDELLFCFSVTHNSTGWRFCILIYNNLAILFIEFILTCTCFSGVFYWEQLIALIYIVAFSQEIRTEQTLSDLPGGHVPCRWRDMP